MTNKKISELPELLDIGDNSMLFTVHDNAESLVLFKDVKQNALDGFSELLDTSTIIKDEARTTYIKFSESYLGAFSSNPSTGFEGLPLQKGCLYYNTVSLIFKVWTGVVWADLSSLTVVKETILSGDGTTVDFTLSDTVNSTASSLVFVDGIQYHANQYAAIGNTIAFINPPPLGTNNIVVRHIKSKNPQKTSAQLHYDNTNSGILSTDLQHALEVVANEVSEYVGDVPEIGGGEIESGLIIKWAGDAPPEGFLLCDGGLATTLDNQGLFSIITDSYNPHPTNYFPFRDQAEFNTTETGIINTPVVYESIGMPSATTNGYCSVISYGGYIYCSGGAGATSTNAINFIKIENDGSIGTIWTSTNPLPESAWLHSTVAFKDRLYMVGGLGTGGAISAVRYASINPNGHIGLTWTPTSSLPTPAYGGDLITHDSYIYYVPSWTSNSTEFTTIYSAQIQQDGSLSAWSVAGTRPNPTYYIRTSVCKDKIYMCTAAIVYYATISNGVIGSWSTIADIGSGGYGTQSTFCTASRMYVTSGAGVLSATIDVDGVVNSTFTRHVFDSTIGWYQAIITSSRVYYFSRFQGKTTHYSLFTGGENNYGAPIGQFYLPDIQANDGLQLIIKG